MKTFFVVVILLAVLGVAFMSNQNKPKMPEENINVASPSDVGVVPIEHASFILNWGGKVIYNDPVGKDLFVGQPVPDIILLSDIHQDHLDLATLKSVAKEKTVIIAPQAVMTEIGTKVSQATLRGMANGEKIEEQGFSIEAIPMYNLPGPSAQYHAQGRGNGYVVEHEGKRVYISGDTAGIPEMRSLKNIDLAFVCMNLPYTMDVPEAASAVLDFKPKTAVPYHYRGQDTTKFRDLVNAGDPNIAVDLIDFYPQ